MRCVTFFLQHFPPQEALDYLQICIEASFFIQKTRTPGIIFDMYTNADAKGSYNPLNDESDDILGLYENDLDAPLSEGSCHENDYVPSISDDDSRIKSERSENRESVAWFKRPLNAEAIPESMNFDEVESIMWRKV